MKQARRDEDETTGAAKQAGRGDDDGRQDYTMTSNEIGETSTSPRPPHRRRSRRPQAAHIPPPQGAGDERADKGKHDDPLTPSAQPGKHTPGTVHPMTQEAENDPGHERTQTRCFRQLTAQTFPHRHHDAAAERGRRAGQTSENEATGRAEKWQRTTSPKMPTRSHRMRFKGMF